MSEYWNTELTPVGPRWVAMKKCPECEGNGGPKETIIRACRSCKSLGYLEVPNKGFILCPKCSGMKSVSVEKKAKCTKCSNRGEIPVLMQKFEGPGQCCRCEGDGYYRDETQSITEICEDCDGVGYIVQELLSIKEWKLKKSKPSPDDVPLNTLDDNGFVFFRSGARARIIECEDCYKTTNCVTCNGEKRCIEISARCEKCYGDGLVGVSPVVDCEYCGGTGIDDDEITEIDQEV